MAGAPAARRAAGRGGPAAEGGESWDTPRHAHTRARSLSFGFDLGDQGRRCGTLRQSEPSGEGLRVS